MMKDPFVCNACGKDFRGITGFDAHRVGEFKDEHPNYGRSCLSDDDLMGLGFRQKNGIWGKPKTEAEKAALAAYRK